MNQILLKKIFIRLILILAVISICSLNILRTMHVYNEWENDEVKVKQPFEISILSTGKSDFILIEIDGKFIVIDAATYDYSRKINEYLQLKGVNEIEYLVFTHNDKDHIGSAPVILDNYKVNNLIQADYGKNTVYYENYIEAIDRNNLKPILLHKIIDDDLSGAHITIYPAKEESYNKSNDYSIIVGIEYGKYRFLFAADAEDERMNEFIKADTGKYTFLKMAHHGIYNNKVKGFLESVQPTYAVVTCSYLRYPDREVLSLLNKYDIKTFYTSNGDITIKSDGKNIYFNQY